MSEPQQPEQGPESDAGTRPRVAVVFGGRSSEHAISCVTAGSVLAALDPEKYDVVPIGIARDGRWVLEAGDPERLRITGRDQLPAVDGERAGVTLVRQESAGELLVHEPSQVPRPLGAVDVVLPLLHGPWGEDGTIQGMLELAGVRYVGAGVLASAAGMDKHYMKLVFAGSGLPVLPWRLVTPRDLVRDAEAVRAAVAELGYPVFVKPCRAGSSFGISKVNRAEDLDAAIALAQEHDPRVLVEAAAVGGREIECGVLEGFGDAAPETSVVAEITVSPEHEFYDFEAKYLPEEATQLQVPADVPDALAAAIRELAARAFEALGCEGLARVDFFVLPAQDEDEGEARVVINEINTMPGFTPSSMFPRMWAESGLDYPALVDRLVQLALHRTTGLR